MKHPYFVTELLKAEYPDIEEFRLNFHRYRPQVMGTVETYREQIPSEILTENYMQSMIVSLAEGFELSVSSWIRRRSGVFHIPMIDFQSADEAACVERLTDFCLNNELGIKRWELFDSGRSFHGYGLDLIPESEYTKYLGYLLLFNLPGKEPVVDGRWVGHRLLEGDMALRWSMKTSQYLRVPQHRLRIAA